MATGLKARELLPLIGIMFSAFVFNTSEFMPVALLVDIAGDFGVSEAQAGMLISVYAWMVMLLSVPLTVVTSRIDFKRLLLLVIAVFGVCQIVSALSVSYWMLMAARVGVACAHSVFWAIVAPIAVRVAAPEHRSIALSMIVTGSAIALIAGLPLGRVVGLLVGWRMTFVCVGVVSLVVFVYLLVSLPRIKAEEAFTFSELPELLRNRTLVSLYILTALIATAYYTGYSYIEPFLQQVVGMDDAWVTVALSVFGVAGIVGSVLFSRLYDKHRFLFVRGTIIGAAVSLLLLRLTPVGPAAAFAVCGLLGMFATAFNVTLQSEVMRSSTEQQQAVAVSIFSGIFNLGIGSGALIGGVVVENLSVSNIGVAGGLIGLAASAYCLFVLTKRLRGNASVR